MLVSAVIRSRILKLQVCGGFQYCRFETLLLSSALLTIKYSQIVLFLCKLCSDWRIMPARCIMTVRSIVRCWAPRRIGSADHRLDHCNIWSDKRRWSKGQDLQTFKDSHLKNHQENSLMGRMIAVAILEVNLYDDGLNYAQELRYRYPILVCLAFAAACVRPHCVYASREFKLPDSAKKLVPDEYDMHLQAVLRAGAFTAESARLLCNFCGGNWSVQYACDYCWSYPDHTTALQGLLIVAGAGVAPFLMDLCSTQ